jgi:hypothetical protein
VRESDFGGGDRLSPTCTHWLKRVLDLYTDSQVDGKRDRQRGQLTDRHADRQTDRQAGKKTERLTDRRTEI